MSKKIVINRCYGGFGLSPKAYRMLGTDCPDYSLDRADPKLVEVVEKLGGAANGCNARLKIVEIPDDVTWYIDSYDGMETVRETHRVWR